MVGNFKAPNCETLCIVNKTVVFFIPITFFAFPRWIKLDKNSQKENVGKEKLE